MKNNLKLLRKNKGYTQIAVQMKTASADGEAILLELPKDRILHIHSCDCRSRKYL